MCTAVSFRATDHYFGRTLDYDRSYGQRITFTPRNYPLPFRDAPAPEKQLAMLGMARIEEGYPLYFDAVNEKGLAAAGLNFVGNACYFPKDKSKTNIAHFEVIPWLLCQCESVSQAEKLLQRVNIFDAAFSEQLPPAQLHWLIADKSKAIVVESTARGLQVYENPTGVLTNNPPFPQQLFHLNDFMHLSPKNPENRFSSHLPLRHYSRGMGALGLPGDLSSRSRFVRAAFVNANAAKPDTESRQVGQFFHILASVEQVDGCCETENGKFERTIYTSCCNTNRGIYYYTTYENRQITAVSMDSEDANGNAPVSYPLVQQEQIAFQNKSARA